MDSHEPGWWDSAAWLDELAEDSPNQDALRTIDPVGLAEALSRHGIEAYLAEDYQQAQQSHTRQIKLLTAWIAAHAADPLFNRTIAARYLSTAYYNRGNNYLNLQQHVKALADYDRAIELGNPEPWSPLIHRALIYETMGRLRAAEEDLLEAQALAPGRLPVIEPVLGRVRNRLAADTHPRSCYPPGSGLPDAGYGAADAGALTVSDALAFTAKAAELLTSYDLALDDALLDRALRLAGKAVVASHGDSALLAASCHILGSVLRARHMRFGDMADLDAAVKWLRQAVDAAPETYADSDTVAADLGACLRLRALRTHSPDDLDEAIALLRRAASSRPSLTTLSNLGNALRNRYRMTGDGRDLDDAVRELRSATEAAPILQHDGQRRAMAFNNLANALLDQYGLSGNQADLSAAVTNFGQAVDRSTPGSPDRIMFTANLAAALADRQPLGQDQGDLDRATTLFRQVCASGMDVAPEGVLLAGQAWGSWASQRNSWEEAAEAFHHGMDAAGRLYEAQSRKDGQSYRSDREAWLRDAQLVPTGAGYAHARLGQLEEAARDFEQGRATLLADALKKKQGSERFFSRPAFELIREAASPGAPLVYMVATASGGLALIVRRDGPPRPMWLPGLKQKDVYRHAARFIQAVSAAKSPTPEAERRRLDEMNRCLDEVTGWLWPTLMEPVLGNLGKAKQVVLIPGGLLGLLPLHAAWTAGPSPGTGRRYVLDAVTVSYAPSARSLGMARRLATDVSPAHLLAVAEPLPVDAPPLPMAKNEAMTAAAAFPASQTTLQGGEANSQLFEWEAPKANVLHLACHGFAALASPLDSGLLLAGGTVVTLGRLMRLQLQVRLAVLSACETALPGTELPDEVVALPTGLLQAGVAGVVASQWRVPDRPTAMLMAEFYRCWRGERMTPAAALRAAQRWLRDTTTEEKRAHFQAAVATHATWLPPDVGRDFLDRLCFEPNGHAHADIRNWGAFAHIGA